MADPKEHILETAETLFAEFGYEGTTIRELAKKAKVNVAMISYYFGSKEKLMESLLAYRSGYMHEKLDELNRLEPDPVKRIEKLVDTYVDRIFTMNRFHKILHREISLQQRSKFNKLISTIILRNKKEIARMIQYGQEKKVFRKVDIELTIASLTGTISHVVLSSFLMCQLLELDPRKNILNDESMRMRVKDHLKDLLKAHLIKQPTR